ncbi:MAG: cupredoxin domain-containing protein [bacterium]
MQDPVIVLAGIILAALILGWFYFRKPGPAQVQRAELSLEGEFRPLQLRVRSGIPLHLHVHRLESEPEEEWFLMPDLGIREPLLPLMTTIVHLEPLRAGEFKMRCSRSRAQGLLIAEQSEE